MKAFLVIRRPSDLLTAVDLMRAGYQLGIAAEPGHLWGPTRPKELHWTEPPPRANGSREVLRLRPRNLLHFLASYLDHAGIEPHLWLEPETEAEWIERVWRHLNFSAGAQLSRIAIIELVQILAEYVGGRIEPHMAYGDPEWVEYCKRGLGSLVCWCQPAPADLHDLMTLRVPLINAARLDSGMVGMVGPAQMPDHGLIRTTVDMDPGAAYDASGRPTGFGRDWDATQRRYRLLGLPVSPEWPLKLKQGLENDVRNHARKMAVAPLSQLVWTCEGEGDPTRPGNPQDLTLMWLEPTKAATHYLHHNWSDVVKVGWLT